MKVGFPGGPRLEWYDRNPLSATIDYLGTAIAGHSVTVRATYTTPTGKKAFLGAASLQFLRVTAAGVLGQIHTYFFAAGSMILMAQLLDNTAGAHLEREINLNAVLLDGESISFSTFDASTGGTVNYSLGAAIMEFDA